MKWYAITFDGVTKKVGFEPKTEKFIDKVSEAFTVVEGNVKLKYFDEDTKCLIDILDPQNIPEEAVKITIG